MNHIRHTPMTAAAPQADHAHRVAFYDSDAGLVESVVDFLRPSLWGGVAVVVAAADHRRAFAAALVASGVDAAAAVRSGRLVVLDASDTLERFLVGDDPHAPAFEQVVGGVLDGAIRMGGPVRVYGEMVAVLWQQGRVATAMRLEELWNQIAATRAFELLCGYPSALFAHPSCARRFEALCSRHTDVSIAPDDRRWLPIWAIGNGWTDERTVRWRFPAELTSGARARVQLGPLLLSWGLADLLDDAELLLSELVNNAVVHAGSQVTVNLSRHNDVLHVEVTDHGPGALRLVDSDLDDTDGRGLMLVDAISSTWGTDVKGPAKTVWFQLRPSAAR